ncbi:STAS domain-containing protein [candidate division KSB1 bacterium]|nr:STAS domain-containing protein [candidate division KSB1 bacterium]
MKISESEVRGIKIVALIGKFDSDYEATEQNLFSMIAGNKNVIVDCKDLTCINSFGLRSLLMLVKNMSKEDGVVVFCNLNDNVKTIFQITGFIHLFLVYNGRDEAIDAVLKSEQ